MLLIFPPVAKPSEPPAGVAKLKAVLLSHGVPCTVLDGNIEGLLYLLQRPVAASDTWTRRAGKNLALHLSALRDPGTYRSRDRYARAVRDVNRLLAVSDRAHDAVVGLADYQHGNLSPLRSADLLLAAEQPERNPFYPWFRSRLPEVFEASFSPRRHRGRGIGNPDPGTEGRTPPQMVGISLNFLSQALCAFAMIGYIRKEFPGLKIVLGGGLVSSWMKRPGWRDPFGGLVDHCVAGPGEGPLLGLLGVRERQQEHVTPDYDDLPVRDYLSPGFVLPYSGSSGCFWGRCSFCPETAEDTLYCPVPPEQAMADIAALTAKTRPVLLHLLDNAVSPLLLRTLAADPPGVPWYGFARISKDLADIDHCMQLKRSGCVMLKLGLESGDQGVLDAMQKGIDLELSSQVLRALKQAGIAAYVYLLFGTPAETIAEARKTLDLIVRHADAIGFLNLAVFNMPLCGREAEEYGTGAFYEGDLSLYTSFRHPRGWDRKLVRQFIESEFKKHPAVSAIVKRDPPVFTSNHAAFFVRD